MGNIDVSLESVTFGILNSEDIQQLSVVKITNIQTFDALGHPLKNGLYDSAMGPVRDRELCPTCSATTIFCPGHFGHIELPLVTINPIFFKTIFNIIRISCANCYRIQVSQQTVKLVQLQLNLLQAGHLTAALDLENVVHEVDDILLRNVNNLVTYDVYEHQVVKECLQLQKATGHDRQIFHNKNSDKLRSRFLANVIKKAWSLKVCKFCLKPIVRVTTSDNKIISHVQTISGKELKIMMPDEILNVLRSIWEMDNSLIKEILPVLKDCNSKNPMASLFFENILVVPPAVRPCNLLKGQLVEHPQTMVYKAILISAFTVRAIIKIVKNKKTNSEKDEKMVPEVIKAYNSTQGKEPLEKLHNAWQELQKNVNNLINCSSDITAGQGLKQIIEKKSGIIRMHMMGKRVNFAARSVITPDPNVDVDEIGIPEAFAMKLSYPVPVTPFNVDELRQMVINGPNVHPGAVMVESGNGRIIRIPTDNAPMRKSLAKRLLTPDESKKIGSNIVHRHLLNGDLLLLNRQPTLHKPSIMAHKARVLKGEKTLRLHYANCKSYNADFDGDEMNAHFPQNELARSEAQNIMMVNKQYLVPKDGTPLGGLIQDHIISGVKMTMRGKFFTLPDYQQLVYQACGHKSMNIRLLPPTIIKPSRLWSGKQVVSTVILNCIPDDKVPITLYSKAKIANKAWELKSGRVWHAGGTYFSNPNCMSESEVVIRKGQLLCGVLDKTHYGSTPYGLIHCAYELYGGDVSGRMLTAFSRVFNLFLQWEGFTLGVEDILVRPRADKKRLQYIKCVRDSGLTAALQATDLPPETDANDLNEVLEVSYNSNPKFRTVIDRKYKSVLDQHTNDINKCCLPRGLIKKFPENNLQLMVQSGAKGSTVNTMQISCLLGQIELEGKRPPLMISGKSLPSFLPYDTSPRSGGFIDGRFMTGIQPQEFFYHCMAGREGLIDTAVKTSRSGYLQRCLIKHLEGISIQYDMTVRDSDNSIIQFAYGEDGMDVCKSQFLKDSQFEFLDDNCEAILDESTIASLKETTNSKEIDKHKKKFKKWLKRHKGFSEKVRISSYSKYALDLINNDSVHKLKRNWFSMDASERAQYNEKKTPDPLTSLYKPDREFGVINENLQGILKLYLKQRKQTFSTEEKIKFENVVQLKAINSLVAPGEAVGLLAAQSIGEPSTQMTLNTFHFAGRGDMNVTLGIPRLREILMIASLNPKTPSMDIPFKENIRDINQKAETLRQKLTRVTVSEVLERIQVNSELKTSTREFICELTFIFLPKSICKSQFMLKPMKILKHIEKKYFSEMFTVIKKVIKTNCGMVWTAEGKGSRQSKLHDEVVNDMSSDEEIADQDDDTTQVKSRLRHNEGQEYEDPESEEEEKSDDENEEIINMEEADEGFGEGSDDSHSASILSTYTKVTNYQYDKSHGRWCKLVVSLPVSFMKVDLTEVLKETASKSVIREVKNIKRAITYMNKNDLTLKTEGINILQMFKYSKLLNLNKLYSNDIHGIAKTYGIEAAVKVIVKEIQNVFGVYGISVDTRHLSLIADYMTYNGVFEPMSRKGMESSVSPLQQMSFESSLTFLKDATIASKVDALASASARLMIGKPCRTGTGSFTVYLDSKLAQSRIKCETK